MQRVAAVIMFLLTTGMSKPMEAATPPTRHCEIVAGQKYLQGPMSGSSVCTEIQRVLAAEAPNVPVRAEITALSTSRLVARLKVNGKALPEHKFAVMDGDLNPAAVQRFARSLALAVQEAVKR